MIDLYVDKALFPHSKWGLLSTPGAKALLSDEGFNYLVLFVQAKTLGGFSYPISKIKEIVKERINFEWKKNSKKQGLPYVSKISLLKYAQRIMTQKVFNILASISNKTESRHTAEWSIRSTICFVMAVAVLHFIPFIKPTEYHMKKKDIGEDGLELWTGVERLYSKIFQKNVSVVPVLPNLVTSTDKTTIFLTPNKIYDKEKVYLVARPTVVKNEKVDSGTCNDYSTKESGDAHCRGLRVVLNTTFTAGGLSAPIFIVVYELTLEEMPKNDIVVLPIQGFTVGADRCIYSDKNGYVVFVRGNYKNDGQSDDDINQENNDDIQTHSKESRVARLYRELVYHEFIHDIRTTQYGWSGVGPVPDHLTAVAWMDGAHRQHKLITSEDNSIKKRISKSSLLNIRLHVLAWSNQPTLAPILNQ